MQTFTRFTLTTQAEKLAERSPDRKAFTIQNRDAANSALICNRQMFHDDDALELFPGQIFGRDIFAPTDAIYARASAGTAKIVLIEDK